MSDSVKIWVRVLVATVGVVVLVLVSSPGGDTEPSSDSVKLSRKVVGCEDGTASGSGPADWRENSIPADVVGIRTRPLSRMTQESRSTYTAKMPVLVEGHHKAGISVVPSHLGRVELIYGRDKGNLAEDKGYDAIQFRPCEDQDRTVWEGGIRVTGRKAVRLRVHVEGEDQFTISLGHPKVREDQPEPATDQAP